MELKEDRILEEVRREPSLSNVEEELEEKQNKTILFLGERIVEPVNPVIFENGIFFVERNSECLVIRPKTVKEYLKLLRGTRRMSKFECGVKEIMIPLSQTRENPMLWFEQTYVQNGKRNQQGRFIQEVWKHRNEVFTEVMLG